jgi:hypothetical protein
VIVLSCGVLLMSILAYIFYPGRRVEAQTSTTRIQHLQEQRDVVYDNLRDLTFEYRAGKYSEEDYLAQRGTLENEATGIIVDLTRLETLKERTK